MRIFVNNVDGYIAGAVCADLFKLSHHIIGTRKSRADDLVPPVVKRLVPRVEVRRLLKAVASSDVVVYDLHDADLEELELVLRTLHISEISQELTIVLISSVGVWGRTHRLYEDTPAATSNEAGGAASDEAAEGGSAAGGEADAAAADASAEGADGSVAVDGSAAGEEAAPGGRRPMSLRSEDYKRRLPAPKFQEWKAIETQLLALKEKHNVRPYVVCAGVPYGNGEEPFLGLFKAAWQTRSTLRVIGDGSNSIPMVHVRDVARCVRHVVEASPSLDYHLAVDRAQITQRELVQAVADELGIPYEIKSVTIAEAVLAELADILTMDMRMLPCDLMNEPYVEAPQPEQDEDAEDGASVEEGGEGQELPPPASTGFRWWSEKGLAANIGNIVNEFTTWRKLQPVRILITGPPGCGSDELARRLCQRYCIPLVGLDAQIEEQKKSETQLGQAVRTCCEQIASSLTNPKEKDPKYFLTAELATQVLKTTLESKPAKFRGNVITGFPSSAEEATEFYLEDPPPPEQVDEEEEAGDPPPPPEKVVKAAYAPAVIVILKSVDEEACLARFQEDGLRGEPEFAKRAERWKKENPEEGPGFKELFLEQFKIDPLVITIDGEEAVSFEAAEEQIVAALESKHQVYNFMPPPRSALDSKADTPGPQVTSQDEAALKREAEERRLKKEHEERIEVIKKDELQRLELHSQPLRDYLMSKVVPSLREGLIEVCREVPDDPIGYLSEYLAVYAQEEKKRRRRKKRNPEPASP